ncbi:MAG TPA: histidine-type phosphatase [Candidatus Angelobacter sp.]|jgi:4-phytase/acid phosphatase
MFARVLCALLLVAPCTFAQSAGNDQPAADQLKMVVILTRHGVRSPLSVRTVQDPWPENQQDWSVDYPGDLTPAGEELVRLMGAYYHEYYSHRGLLPRNCPAKEVSIWADNEERTVQTGRELAQGLAGRSSGCNISVNFRRPYSPCTLSEDKNSCQRPSSNDQLFHPLSSSDDAAGLQAIADDINSRYSDLLKQYRKPFADLKATLCPAKGDCLPLDCPSQPQAQCAYYSSKDKKLHWDGPFNVGSTASEIFLLEYANGLPCAKVGWGRVTFNTPNKDLNCSSTGQLFRQMQEIHTAYFQETQRALYIAAIQSIPLVVKIADKLDKAMQPKPPAERLVIFSGHDTNIANVAALLGLSWKLPDLPDNDTPPAGALVFELYKDSQTDTYWLQARYVYQLLEQLRTKAVLTLDQPPKWIELTFPGCESKCRYDVFKNSVVQPALHKQFSPPRPQAK